MKSILQFNLDNASDNLAFKRAVKSTDVYLVLFNLQQEFRQYYKYDKAVNKTGDQVAEELQDFFYEQLTQYGIDMGDLE